MAQYLKPDCELGYIEDNAPRMVMTPWYENEIPFEDAAEIGTKKVITDHSTIGLVITTDGSITDIERHSYEDAECRVIRELQAINKPFIVLLKLRSISAKTSLKLYIRLHKVSRLRLTMLRNAVVLFFSPKTIFNSDNVLFDKHKNKISPNIVDNNILYV